jgi:hypothetical protein
MQKYHFTNTQKMNLTIWAGWLADTDLPQGEEALKSGELLYDDDNEYDPSGISDEAKYCCLGIYVQYRNPKRFSEDYSNVDGSFYCPYKKNATWLGKSNTSFLPVSMARELGIYTGEMEDVGKNNLQDIFVKMNDDWGYSFEKISQEVLTLVDTGDFTEATQERVKGTCLYE